MRLEFIDDDTYKVFINKDYIKDFDIDKNDDIGTYIKSIILKMRKLFDLVLEGFYEVHVYRIQYIGLILEIQNIDTYLSKTIDLKIIVHNDEEFYLKVYRYDLIHNYKNLYYFNDKYYLNINDVKKEDVLKLIENCEIVFGDHLQNLKHKWKCLT